MLMEVLIKYLEKGTGLKERRIKYMEKRTL